MQLTEAIELGIVTVDEDRSDKHEYNTNLGKNEFNHTRSGSL